MIITKRKRERTRKQETRRNIRGKGTLEQIKKKDGSNGKVKERRKETLGKRKGKGER